MLQIWARGQKPYLSRQETDESIALGRLWLQAYQKLAHESQSSQRLLWRIRPKLHYCDHLLSHTQATMANPEAYANWIDEDHMKWLSALAAAVSSRTCYKQLARRYLLKRTLAWSR